MTHLETMRAILRKNKMRITKQREEILTAVLENKDRHMSCQEIYDEVAKNNPDVGIATVYRTLALFVEKGILFDVDFGDGVTRYDLFREKEEHMHIHLVCKNCDRVFEIDENLLDSVERKIKKDYGFTVSDHSVKFFGICGECRGKRKPGS